MQDILLAEVLRNGVVESRHAGAYVVADAAGGLVAHGGDPDRAIYPRSAVKALQALPLIIGGAAARFGLTSAELALACASHAGEVMHTQTAAVMLAKAGRDVTCLECGTHWPSSGRAARALAAGGLAPNALHNNCSGKHAGFVCTAIAAGIDVPGYVEPTHTTMRAVTAALGEVTGIALDHQSPATDGCSIPTYKIPLLALARGFARFGNGAHLSAEFGAAAAVLRAAVAENPLMIAGHNRFDTVVSQALGAAAFVKTGAEGVYCASLPSLGLGIALKCSDGAARAAEAAMAALVARFLGPHPVLSGYAERPLTNWNGRIVGAIVARVGG